MDLQGAPGSFQQGIVTRAKNIILTPSAEWDVIGKEQATVSDIYKNYVMILAAIGPLAAMTKGLVFGYSALGVTYRPEIGQAVATAVLGYGFALLNVFIIALIIDALAPGFGAEKNRLQAFKLAAYSLTASWLAGIFALLPGLGFLGLLGLYSLYLLYAGLPKLMRAPADKALAYTAVTVVAAILVGFVGGLVIAPVIAMLGTGSPVPIPMR